MLVLRRRVGEEIVIDGQIRIIVVEVKRNGTTLGIFAPPSVRVDRKEIHERRWMRPSCGDSAVEKAAT
jgi:carbon storage regulator CsrA